MAVPSRFFACETRVVCGLGCLSQLGEELSRYKIFNPALVVDAGIAKAGLLEQWLSPEITNAPARILAPMNPDLESVREGIDVAKAAKCDGVVIVGGGSSICLGKAIAICLVNPGDILEYEGNEKMQNVRCHGYFDEDPLSDSCRSCQYQQYACPRRRALALRYLEYWSCTNMAGQQKSS